MKALVFAAGLGTRLKPITDTIPKALVPVCGQPLIYYVICKLRDAGYDEIVVNVHHFPEQIHEYLATHDLGVSVAVSDESSELLETGGGILHAEPLIMPCSEPFLVHNVDIISNLNLGWVQRETRPEALATLVVSPRKTRRNLLFDADMRLVGWMDNSTGEVRSPFPDLDPSACLHYAFAGIHNLSPFVFEAFRRWGFEGRFPIMDFYLKACAKEPIYGLAAQDLVLVDVGKFDQLDQAQEVCETILNK